MLLKEFEFLHSPLQAVVSFIGFAHIHSLVLRHNETDFEAEMYHLTKEIQ